MNQNLTCVVYCWENKINKKKYIGSTVNLKHRFYSHIYNITNKELNSDINTLGISSFMFTILEFIDIDYSKNKSFVRNLLREKEQYYIDSLLKDHNGNFIKSISYNISELSSGSRFEISKETLKKMSDSAKIKVFTEEHKKNISKNHISKKEGFVSHAKGKPMSTNAKIKLAEYYNLSKIKVYQYNLYGDFICKYDSIKEAAIKNNFDAGNISKCVNKKIKTYKDYIFSSNEDISDRLKSINLIEMFDLDLNKKGDFPNAYEIEKRFNIHHTNVSYSIKTGKPTVGFYFQLKKNK